MRPQALNAPFEWFFALLMAASPIVGSFWVSPHPARWAVFGVGCAMVLGVLIAGAKPVKTG